jgi:hypothetical protein
LFLHQSRDQHEHDHLEDFIVAYNIIKEMHINGFRLNIAKPISNKGADVIIRAMSAHEKSPDILTSAMDALYALTYANIQNANILGKPGMKMVSDTLQEHVNDENVSSSGLSVLVNMVTSSRKRKSYALDIGVTVTVMRVMRQHPHCRRAQRAGCDFHHNMFLDTMQNTKIRARDTFLQNDGINAVLCAMRTFPDDATLQLSSCECFFHCHTVEDGDLANIDVSVLFEKGLDVPDAVMHAMRIHKDSCRIQRSGLSVLKLMAAGTSYTVSPEYIKLAGTMPVLGSLVFSAATDYSLSA